MSVITINLTQIPRLANHDDVMKLERFPHHWPFEGAVKQISDALFPFCLNKPLNGRVVGSFRRHVAQGASL